jgi:hypothetical protein
VLNSKSRMRRWVAGGGAVKKAGRYLELRSKKNSRFRA